MNRTTGQSFVRFQAGSSALFGANTRFHALLPAVLCLALIWPFGGGWKSAKMMAGTVTPGAQGTVRFRTGSNDNTELDIKTSALAPPSSLTPPKNIYVVWLQPPGEDAKDLGALKVGSDEQGELKTVTPNKRFKVFITAEQNGNLKEPEGPIVLSADVTQG